MIWTLYHRLGFIDNGLSTETLQYPGKYDRFIPVLVRYFVIARRVLVLFHFDCIQGSPLVVEGLPIVQKLEDLHRDLYFEDLDNILTIVPGILLQMSFLTDNIPFRGFQFYPSKSVFYPNEIFFSKKRP